MSLIRVAPYANYDGQIEKEITNRHCNPEMTRWKFVAAMIDMTIPNFILVEILSEERHRRNQCEYTLSCSRSVEGLFTVAEDHNKRDKAGCTLSCM